MATVHDHGNTLDVPTDVTDDDDLVSLVETTTEEFGRIDILVNGAGFGLYGTVEETPLDDAHYQFEFARVRAFPASPTGHPRDARAGGR